MIFNSYSASRKKRIFDIVFSLIVLVSLSPLMILVAIIIKLTSKGPVFYVSNRVGKGYTVFRFYKFRSMYVGSDKNRIHYSDMNMFLINKIEEELSEEKELTIQCPRCAELGKPCSSLLYIENRQICEYWYYELKTNFGTKTRFFKIKNDPRVTPVGRFLRRTNIDELPQFFNILEGKMSVVGNRPLPIYEAEKLTSDLLAYRYLAPSGVTGLWQISKNRFQSEDKRINLDNQYALIASFKKDFEIILKTIPTVFRKSNH